MTVAIGIDLGGTQIKGRAWSAAGDELASSVTDTEDQTGGGIPQFARNVKRLVGELEAAAGAPATHIGVSAPGLAAANGRSIAFMPGRMHGLEGFDWSDW